MCKDWYDYAMEDLERELYEGYLTKEEFDEAVDQLDEEYREAP